MLGIPQSGGGKWHQTHSSASFAGSSTFRLFDAKGNLVRKVKFEGNGTLSLTGLSAGVYAYRMENEGYMRFGQLVVGD